MYGGSQTLSPRLGYRGLLETLAAWPGTVVLFDAHMDLLSSESSSLLFLFICLALCCFINQNLKRRISLLYCHLAED